MLHYLEVIDFFNSCTNAQNKLKNVAMQAGCATKGKKPKTHNNNLGDGAPAFQTTEEAQQSIPIPFSYSQLLMVSVYMIHFPLYKYI